MCWSMLGDCWTSYATVISLFLVISDEDNNYIAIRQLRRDVYFFTLTHSGWPAPPQRISLRMTFNVTCTVMDVTLRLNLSERTPPLTRPFVPGNVVNMLDPNTPLSGDPIYIYQWFTTTNRGTTVRLSGGSYRIHNRIRHTSNLPFRFVKVSNSTSSSSGGSSRQQDRVQRSAPLPFIRSMPTGWIRNKFTMNATALASPHVKDIMFSWAIAWNLQYSYRPEQRPLLEMVVRFQYGLWRRGPSGPIVKVGTCKPGRPWYTYRNGQTLMIPQEENKVACFRVELDGNPLPKMFVYEVDETGTDRVQLMTPYVLTKLATYEDRQFYLPPLNRGASKLYRIRFTNLSHLDQRVRVVASRPFPRVMTASGGRNYEGETTILNIIILFSLFLTVT